MKKVLGLLLLSSSMFSMQLAYKLQTPCHHFSRVTSKIIPAEKPQAAYTIHKQKPTISHEIDTKQVLIGTSSVHIPHNLTNVELYHGAKGFVIQQGDKQHVIEKCFMDPIARSITKEGLKPFLKVGYFAVNQTNDGIFTLKAHHRLTGGGPLFGKFMYWATKVTCYTVLMAATAGMVIGGGSIGVGIVKAGTGVKLAVTTAKATEATASTLLAASNIKIASAMAHNALGGYVGYVGGMATVTEGSGAALFSSGGIAAGMIAPTVVAAGIIEAGHAPACAKVVGAALATGTSHGGIVAGIEFVSLSVGLACGLAPTP